VRMPAALVAKTALLTNKVPSHMKMPMRAMLVLLNRRHFCMRMRHHCQLTGQNAQCSKNGNDASQHRLRFNVRLARSRDKPNPLALAI